MFWDQLPKLPSSSANLLISMNFIHQSRIAVLLWFLLWKTLGIPQAFLTDWAHILLQQNMLYYVLQYEVKTKYITGGEKMTPLVADRTNLKNEKKERKSPEFSQYHHKAFSFSFLSLFLIVKIGGGNGKILCNHT